MPCRAVSFFSAATAEPRGRLSMSSSPLATARGRADQILRLGAGETPRVAAWRHAEIGHPFRRGMGAHVADLFARQQDDFAAQAAGEFDIDLLADNAPGQPSKPVGRQGRRRPLRGATKPA